MKTLLLLFLSILFVTSSIVAQNPIIWKKTYNNIPVRYIKDIIITDTSYYILSETATDVELININKLTGMLNFSKIYGGSSLDLPSRMYKTNSSIYIFGETGSQEGIFDHNHGNWDVFNLKTDFSGILIDSNFFGGTLSDQGGFSIFSDNKYVCSGKSNSIDGDLSSCSSTINKRSWIFISDSIGNIQQYKCNDTIDPFTGRFFFRNDHYYLITSGTFMQSGGYTYDYPPNSQGNPQGPSSDFLVVEYDTLLNIINVKNYGSDSREGLTSTVSTNDKGFMLIGYTDYIHDTLEVTGGLGGRDFYCVKLDSNANFQWSKCFGTLGNDNSIPTITETQDHGFLILGSISESTGNVSYSYGKTDIWLAKIDSVGNLIWERTYGGSYYDRASIVKEDSDGTIIIAGTTNSTDGTFSGLSIQGQSDMYIIKLAPWVGINNSEKTDFSVRIYPNPAHSSSSINLKGLPIKNSHYQLSIYNIQGQQLNAQQFNASYTKQVQLPQLSNGVYFIRLINNKGIVRTAKIIIN